MTKFLYTILLLTIILFIFNMANIFLDSEISRRKEILELSAYVHNARPVIQDTDSKCIPEPCVEIEYKESLKMVRDHLKGK